MKMRTRFVIRKRPTVLVSALVAALVLGGTARLTAQELQCDVTIDVDKLPSSARDNLRDFEASVEQYMNTYIWTDEDMGGEKIPCAIQIQFISSTSDYRFSAQAFVGSRRPVYVGNDVSERETIILRLLDERWEFEYTPNRPLYHDEFQFDPIADFLDYYAYLIIGFDFETYTEFSGMPLFQKALNICNQASSSGFSKGWGQQSGVFSRFGFVDELMDLKNQSFRTAFFQYHFDGIDLLATEPVKGLNAMLEAIQTIAQIREKQNPRSILVKTFFDTKYMEIAELFLRYPDRSVYSKLATADPSHTLTYQEYSLR